MGLGAVIDTAPVPAKIPRRPFLALDLRIITRYKRKKAHGLEISIVRRSRVFFVIVGPLRVKYMMRFGYIDYMILSFGID